MPWVLPLSVVIFTAASLRQCDGRYNYTPFPGNFQDLPKENNAEIVVILESIFRALRTISRHYVTIAITFFEHRMNTNPIAVQQNVESETTD